MTWLGCVEDRKAVMAEARTTASVQQSLARCMGLPRVSLFTCVAARDRRRSHASQAAQGPLEKHAERVSVRQPEALQSNHKFFGMPLVALQPGRSALSNLATVSASTSHIREKITTPLYARRTLASSDASTTLRSRAPSSLSISTNVACGPMSGSPGTQGNERECAAKTSKPAPVHLASGD
eukprot:2912303-Pleurochrysis_carterae.AAC.1